MEPPCPCCLRPHTECECECDVKLEAFDIGGKSTDHYIALPYFKMNKVLKQHTRRLAHEALETFQDTSGKQYQFVSLQKAAIMCPQALYYLTFTAKQKDATSKDVFKTIQAVVRAIRLYTDVLLCRIKPAARPAENLDS